MNLREWLEVGIEAGFCSRPVCDAHDGTPTTSEEDAAYDKDGDYPCIPIVRIWEDGTTFIEVAE